MKTETNSDFEIAYHIVIAEFCSDAQKKGMTYEQIKKALAENRESIASIIKGVMESI